MNEFADKWGELLISIAPILFYFIVSLLVGFLFILCLGVLISALASFVIAIMGLFSTNGDQTYD